MEYKPVVVAHRGLWFGQFVENSRQAFEAASRAGFAAECDVWKSADGEPVVIHDMTLDHTTRGRGPVNEYAASELRQLGVPMLAEVADLVHLVEIKPEDDRELVERVIERMRGKRWLLQSFNSRNLHHAARMDPAIPLALLIDDASLFHEAIEFRWSVHANHESVDEPVAGRIHSRGLKLGVWTVNTEPDLLRLIPARPDVIISDHPQRIVEVLHRRGIQSARLGDWHA